MEQPQKLSRYRTVRKAQANHAPHVPSQSNDAGANAVDLRPAPPAPVVASVGRTASRYRKAGLPVSADETAVLAPPVPPIPSPPEQPSRYHRTTEQFAAAGRPYTASGEHVVMSPALASANLPSRKVSGTAPTSQVAYEATSPPTRPDGHAAMAQERLRRRQDEPQSPPIHVPSRSVEAATRKRTDSHRQTDEEDGTRLRRHVSQPRDIPLQGVGIVNGPQPMARQASNNQTRTASNPAHPHSKRDPSADPTQRQWHDAPVTLAQYSALPDRPSDSLPTIKPGGGGIVPGTDAPQSAVNFGERRVLLMFNNTSMQFPVTLDTTPLHLLRSAANCFSDHFEPRGATLTEIYSKANVQRPIRMYERVRDIMNSWDDDHQHSLVVEPSTLDSNNELFASFAPKERPTGASWDLYHSSKPGKWDKRTIILSSEGQLFWSKLDGKDSTRICHLDDFDIYTVMPRRMKKVKAPKKHCFAIKSQQKSTVFMDTSTFVQFFATNDDKIARDFHRSVQDWRSWYLVDVLGEGKKKKKPAPIKTKVAPKMLEAPLLTGKSSKSSSSADSHYLLGTFNNLGFDPTNFETKTPPRPRRPSYSDEIPLAIAFPNAPMTRAATVRKNGGPAISQAARPQRRQDDTRTGSDSDDVFASRGRRVRAPGDHHRALQPTVMSPLQGAVQHQTARTASARRPPDQAQSGSDPETGAPSAKPKPLIDLTPAYVAPKQHQKKGHGHYPEKFGAGNLIEAATTPDNHIDIPPSRDWRGANALAPTSAPMVPTTGVARPGPARRPSPPNAASEVTSPHATAGFTDHSLLASMVQTGQEGWGAGWGGHGVKRNGTLKHVGGDKPLLDMNEASRFAQGSLVQALEKKGHVGADAVQ